MLGGNPDLEPEHSTSLSVGALYESNLQGSYEFDGPRWQWLRHTRLSVGIQNILDTQPPSDNGDGGYAKIDPRLRRFYLSLRSDF